MHTLSTRELIKFKGIWHSIKLEHINSILKSNELEARTTQRYWKDGIVHRDSAGEDYLNSHYMKGWSFTRDRDYAFSWADVTMLFDWELIRRDFKTKPISWNYRSQHCKGNFNKEREEFIFSNLMNQTFEEIKAEYFEITDLIYDGENGEEALKIWASENGEDFIEYWQRKGKRTINLNKYLLGIFVNDFSYNIYKGKGFELAINHPLFKGFISSSKSRDNHDNSMRNTYI